MLVTDGDPADQQQNFDDEKVHDGDDGRAVNMNTLDEHMVMMLIDRTTRFDARYGR